MILFTELDAETNNNHVLGFALDRGNGVEFFLGDISMPGLNFTEFATPILLDYEVNDPSNLPMEIEFEGSTIGVPLLPGIGTDSNSPPIGDPSVPIPPEGERGSVIGDLILNSALQNPSIANGMTNTFPILPAPDPFPRIFALENIDGPDLIVLEIGLPVGQSPASGVPASQGGAPFAISINDEPFVTFTNTDYVTLGNADESGPMAFFNGGVDVIDDDLVELGELETNPLLFRTATSGLSVNASVLDLSDLGIPKDTEVELINIRSISDELPENVGFAPDIVEIFSLSIRSSSTSTSVILSSTGVLDMTPLIPLGDEPFSIRVIPAVGTDNITEIITTRPDIRLQVERNVSFNPPSSNAPEDQAITFTVNGFTFIPVVPVLTKGGLLILALLLMFITLCFLNKSRFKAR